MMIDALAHCLAWIWFHCVRIRRKEMQARVSERLCLSSPAAEAMVAEVYFNLARNLLEPLIRGPVSNGSWPIEVRGWANLIELRRRSKGYVVITAHMGNWEVLTHLADVCGISGAFVSKRFRVSIFQHFLISN